MLTRAYGIARSLAMYHGIPGRQRRMREFYSAFLEPGALAFDVGAHAGNRVRAWRGLGARVVAIEPQPDFVRILKVLFDRDDDVTVLPMALGAEPGTARLGISRATPTVSSMSSDWRRTVSDDAGFAGVRWQDTVPVQVTTLDQLIAEHGVPDFCKIDVEGFEADVVAGLSHPLPALSFEWVPAAHDDALAVIARLESLGPHRYRYSPVETMRWDPDAGGEDGLDAEGMTALLDRRRPLGRSGDVYVTPA
ncbi:FkbM family methyltransferase [Pseudonocardia nematodicida]|uniref:FkbM family methyltransferase n=1 Tax=Pseudonocardia nematodicida TaxID=1206997 RepID=A0ABV1KGC3_9PSEU